MRRRPVLARHRSIDQPEVAVKASDHEQLAATSVLVLRGAFCYRFGRLGDVTCWSLPSKAHPGYVGSIWRSQASRSGDPTMTDALSFQLRRVAHLLQKVRIPNSPHLALVPQVRSQSLAPRRRWNRLALAPATRAEDVSTPTRPPTIWSQDHCRPPFVLADLRFGADFTRLGRTRPWSRALLS
jgi:hypothetical protein